MASTARGDREREHARRRVFAERVVAAPAGRIFDLLADPAAHARFDGSGTVVAGHPRNPRRLGPGARFTMDMRVRVAYRMWNTVVEYEPDRRIAWRQELGHHVWRYELEPVTATATLVRETFDWATCRAKWLIRVMDWDTRNQRSMVATLERLAALVEPAG
ncbi:SRPBCC family protein [Couchioplanes azureus]|uniref:SRPBCC family protein n=1 Tax=Couchioplanes caeruleus TaxID=56438 RepID=UPI001E5FCBE3|nr:SRPBCC family protein [Couchioplanes caeruleus]